MATFDKIDISSSDVSLNVQTFQIAIYETSAEINVFNHLSKTHQRSRSSQGRSRDKIRPTGGPDLALEECYRNVLNNASYLNSTLVIE